MPFSREIESKNTNKVVQGMLMKFEYRIEIGLCLNALHSYGIHGSTYQSSYVLEGVQK